MQSWLYMTPDGRTLLGIANRSKYFPVRQDGKTVARFEPDGEILAWDLATSQQLPSMKHIPPRSFRGLAFSPDGSGLIALEMVAGEGGLGTRNLLTFWDLRTRTPRPLVDGYWLSTFAPDGKTFAAINNDYQAKRTKVVLWELASGKERAVLADVRQNYFSDLVFSPDGRYVAACQAMLSADKPPELKLWDVDSAKVVASFAAPVGTTPFIRPGSIAPAFGESAFSADGRWLAVFLRKGQVFLYDVARRKLVWSQKVACENLRQLAFSPDGQWLAVSGQDTPVDRQPREEINPYDMPQPRIFLFDRKANRGPEEVVAPHGFVGFFAFSPDSKTLALGSSGCVLLFAVSRPTSPR
jgi:WD40 repeat protein